MTTHAAVENLSVVTHNSIPVITTELLAQLYATEAINIQVNHTRNRDRFVEGKHYFKLEGIELKELKNRLTESKSVAKRTRSLILWTERGAARHAKMLETDQAWEVFEKLEDFYFNKKEEAEPVRKTRQSTAKQLTPLRQTVERLIASGVGQIYPDVWKLVHQKFGVEHIHQLQPAQVGEAVAYLDALEGEYLGKLQELQVPGLSDYSMQFFSKYLHLLSSPIRTPWEYPAKLLIPNGDSPNPLGRMLVELKRAGYQVDAAMFQLQALQHHLEVNLSRLNRVQDAMHWR